MMVTCIKQHLSDIWSSIHEKVKQHWGWVEKSVAYEKNAYIVSDRNVKIFKTLYNLKGTVMQIEKALINDRLCVSNVSWKFHIPTIYSFAVIYP